MPARTTDTDGFSAEDRGFQFADDDAAMLEAKVALVPETIPSTVAKGPTGPETSFDPAHGIEVLVRSASNSLWPSHI